VRLLASGRAADVLEAAPGQLPAEHRRWIVLNAVLAPAAINVMLNAGLSWASAMGRDRVPLWGAPLAGGPSMIWDTIGTLFLLPLITCLLATAAVRRDQRRGSLERLRARPLPLLPRLPRRPLARGAVLGTACVAVLGPPAVALLVSTDFRGLTVAHFVLYKVLISVALGMLVTPVIALYAMADRRQGAR
jgi:hypothetical protein